VPVLPGGSPRALVQVGDATRLYSTPVAEKPSHIGDESPVDRPPRSGGVRLAAGSRLGPYRIDGLIGSGGMGDVYRAVDTRLNRPVAIKASAEQFGGRFDREAHAIAALNHPNICTLYDVGPDYLVMELVEGETLASRLRKGALPIELVVQYGVEIARALRSAHDKRIVHRDLKPGNVMITRSGVKVLDFGLAKELRDETQTATNAILGTPAYMAPEQLAGEETDTRTDIYARSVCFSMKWRQESGWGVKRFRPRARCRRRSRRRFEAVSPMTPTSGGSHRPTSKSPSAGRWRLRLLPPNLADGGPGRWPSCSPSSPRPSSFFLARVPSNTVPSNCS